MKKPIYLFIFWLLKGELRQYWLGMAGLALITAFILIRASSFNHIEYFLGRWRTIGPLRMKYIMELSGILMIGGAAIQKLRHIHFAK